MKGVDGTYQGRVCITDKLSFEETVQLLTTLFSQFIFREQDFDEYPAYVSDIDDISITIFGKSMDINAEPQDDYELLVNDYSYSHELRDLMPAMFELGDEFTSVLPDGTCEISAMLSEYINRNTELVSIPGPYPL